MAKNYLQRRGNRFYFRMKVPVDLREAMSRKEIKVALHTSDVREASRRVKFEAVKAEALFAEARSKMKPGAKSEAARRVDESEALLLVARWLSNLEQESEAAFESDLEIFQRPEDLQFAKETAALDEFVHSGGGQWGDLWYGSGNYRHSLEQILKEENAIFAGDQSSLSRLAGVIRRGHLEVARRDLGRLQQVPLPPLGEFCRPAGNFGLSSETLRTSQCDGFPTKTTVGALLDLFEVEQEKAGRSPATVRTYQVPIRLLREVLGDKTDLRAVDRSSIAGIRDLILSLPANARTRYRGKSLKEAIEAAKRDRVPPIQSKTAANYFRNIHAIFSFAVKIGLLGRNPASDEWLKKSLEGKKSAKKRPTFTAETLPQLLTALSHPQPAMAGKLSRNSGRFWVPLLGLFQGFRLNEACQLYTEDVTSEEGTWCIRIRECREDGSRCEKKLKNSSSERTVPIHPRLIETGFISFVNKRRQDGKSARLFPDLPLGKKGYYSDPFQKWFGRFLNSVFGEERELSFHCFRHTWRDALRVAKVPDEIVKWLGGWTTGSEVQSRYGHGYPIAMLHEELSKITFPGTEILGGSTR